MCDNTIQVWEKAYNLKGKKNFYMNYVCTMNWITTQQWEFNWSVIM